MQAQASSEAQQAAEQEVFDLRRNIDGYAVAGDGAEVARIQLEISAIQRKHGAVTGAGRRDDERTARRV